MEYIGLTEDEMLELLVDFESDMQAQKNALLKRYRTIVMREDEIERRMKHFESTYLMRRIIAENNRRITDTLDSMVGDGKKNLFL